MPPAVDLTQDRVSWHEIVERNTPEWPRLSSPDHDALALPALQAKLDAEAAHHSAAPQAAFVPGSGDLPPRNAADIAWSEYNHHWAGLFVVAIGLLALLQRAGLRWARHWPLLFLGLGGVPVLPLRSRDLAAGRYRLPGELSRRGGVAAPLLRAADRGVRRVRVAGARHRLEQPRMRRWCFRCSAPAAARCC